MQMQWVSQGRLINLDKTERTIKNVNKTVKTVIINSWVVAGYPLVSLVVIMGILVTPGTCSALQVTCKQCQKVENYVRMCRTKREQLHFVEDQQSVSSHSNSGQ